MNSRLPNLHRTRLRKATVLFTVIPALAVVALAFALTWRDLDAERRRQAAADMTAAADAFRERIELRLESALLPMRILAHSPDLERMSGAELQDALETLKSAQPWVDGLEILPSRNESSAENTVRITDVQPGSDGTPRFFITVDGTVRASANAFLFSALLDGERLGRTGEAYLVNEAGTLQTRSVLHGPILGRVDEALFSGGGNATGVSRREWGGTSLLYATRSLDNLPGWRLVVQRDERELAEARHRTAARLALAGLLGVAILAGGALAGVRRILAIQTDMDREHARLRECELQVRKLDAISQLGVGIAHEVNNPLAIIGEEVGWMQDVLKRESFREHPDADELRDSLRQIVAQTARSREITHKLLSFGGKTDGTVRDTDLNALVSDVTLLRRREASGKGVEIIEHPAEKLPVILSEPALLRQVLIILINNCLDAMPEGGTITVSTEPLPGGGAKLEIRDTGFGIPLENMDRIFDPFFTTKPPGKGAGLGLSICHGIMQRIGGRISADSVPGQGTTVTVELPMEARPLKP